MARGIHKISVSFDGINFFWVVVKYGKFIRNPTREDLKDAIVKYYNRTNICPTCRKEYNIGEISELTDKSILYPKNAMRGVNKYGNKTGEFVCSSHWRRYYQRYDPNSSLNARKSVANRRTGNNNDLHLILSENCEYETTILFGAEKLSDENYSYNLPLDSGPITDNISIMIGDKLVYLFGKVLQTKGSNILTMNIIKGLSYYEYERWLLSGIEGEWIKKFDHLIFYCITKDRKMIERIYVFPKEEIIGKQGISIIKNNSRGIGWYEKYRVTDIEFLERANRIWQKIINKNNSTL
jgi:hypothetical protein